VCGDTKAWMTWQASVQYGPTDTRTLAGMRLAVAMVLTAANTSPSPDTPVSPSIFPPSPVLGGCTMRISGPRDATTTSL